MTWQEFVLALFKDPLIAGLLGMLVGTLLNYRLSRRTAFDIFRKQIEHTRSERELNAIRDILDAMVNYEHHLASFTGNEKEMIDRTKEHVILLRAKKKEIDEDSQKLVEAIAMQLKTALNEDAFNQRIGGIQGKLAALALAHFTTKSTLLITFNKMKNSDRA